MINTELKEKIETTWPKPQQRDFYQLICQKRQQIRTLIQTIRNQN
ncbi:MAG: hypothetical protein ACO36I_22345 [Candidatus Latescibacterota bacterium]|jgi:hypothetical protein